MWLKYFGLSTLVCVHAIRMITNYAPIGEYRLGFFPKESFVCLCGNDPIETKRHIMFDYVRYKKSWNYKRKSLKDVLMFLEFNSNTFCF